MAAAKPIIIGDTFGKLSALENQKKGHEFLLMRCECGRVKIARIETLRAGRCRSCGCIKWPNRTNGYVSPERLAWKNAKARCSNPKHADYRHYGGRGIYVCERWLSFDNFRIDMGERPKGASLDRIDNDGPYSPDNCRWAYRAVQARNKRVAKLLTANGITKNACDWANDLGINQTSINARLARGWSVQDAVTVRKIPAGKQHKDGCEARQVKS